MFIVLCFIQKHSILCSEIKKDTICRVIGKRQHKTEEGKKWKRLRKQRKKQLKRK